MKRKIPNFRSEDEEREFWATRDSTQHLDWRKGRQLVLSNLKPSVKTISLRLPESMVEELKLLANKRDIPYQSTPRPAKAYPLSTLSFWGLAATQMGRVV